MDGCFVVISNHFLCKELVHHPIDFQPLYMVGLGVPGHYYQAWFPPFQGQFNHPCSDTRGFFSKSIKRRNAVFLSCFFCNESPCCGFFFWRKKTSLKQPFPCNPCNYSCTTWGFYKPQTNITELLWFSNSGSCHPRFLAEPFWVPLLMLLPTKRPSLRRSIWQLVKGRWLGEIVAPARKQRVPKHWHIRSRSPQICCFLHNKPTRNLLCQVEDLITRITKT